VLPWNDVFFDVKQESLLGFLVIGVLTAELTILAHLNFLGLSFLVFCCKIHRAAALFCAHESNEIAHESPQTKAYGEELQNVPAFPEGRAEPLAYSFLGENAIVEQPRKTPYP
jgi:hypothetical protein